MTTLSQLTDEMAGELVRLDLIKTGLRTDGGYIASSINQTIREVHTGKNGVAHHFDANRVEIELTVDSLSTANMFVWDIPQFNRLQAIEAVEYSSVGRRARRRPPGVVNLENRGVPADNYYWYQSGNAICFSGFGVVGSIIKLSAFYYPRSLFYHRDSPLATGTDKDPRWAEHDSETDTWVYRPDTGKTNPELEELSTNWVMARWTDMIREGVRAKVYKRLGDENRQRTSYSSYESMRVEMQTQEISQGVAYSEG
jgi:hypothetical protein